MKSLEAQLNKDTSEKPLVDKYTSKYEAFLGMLNQILSSDNIEQKSRLMFENIKGMVQAQVYQMAVKNGYVFQQIDERFVIPINFLKQRGYITQADLDRYGKEGLASLKSLCEELIVRVVSLDGLGRGEMVKAMNLMIQEHEHQDNLAQNMILGPRR